MPIAYLVVESQITDPEAFKLKARALRQGATALFNMVLVEGVDAPV